MKIAWIGTGVMGKSMAAHLVRAGHDVTLYNRTHKKAVDAASEIGATSAPELADAVMDAEAVFTIVGYPADVEAVMLGKDGVFAHAKRGCLIIDMTTSLPSLAVRLYDEAKNKGFHMLDAPVSGGDAGARNGTLSIMVGGDLSDFEKAMPLFELLGKNVVYMGGAGSGQHTKAANQIAVAGATAAMTEAIHYSRKVGLDPEQMLKAIGAGAAGSWQLANMAPRVLKEDFAPGFFVKHFIKDMKIIVQEMSERDVDLVMLNQVLAMYEQFAGQGHEDAGTQALIRLYEG